MSRTEAEAFIREGKFWLANVWIRGDYQERDNMLQRLNATFERVQLLIRISRGWQHYDPVVRVNGKPHTYAALVLEMTSSDDGGIGGAQTFREWYSGNNVTLQDLALDLLALAVITHFAEVGRGYESSLVLLYGWIDDICNAGSKQAAIGLWNTYGDRFPPALKYDQDMKKEWA